MSIKKKYNKENKNNLVIQENQIYTEKDNMGTRYNSADEWWEGYWLPRLIYQSDEPFINYIFDSATEARNALMDLDFIKEAEDTKKLISTEVLTFGYYDNENGKYKAVLCGYGLTHEIYIAANESFTKHGGTLYRKKEPEKSNIKHQKSQNAKLGKVIFIEEYIENRMGTNIIYRIYKADNALSAKAFLKENPVTTLDYQLVVRTPEGNYGRGIHEIYRE